MFFVKCLLVNLGNGIKCVVFNKIIPYSVTEDGSYGSSHAVSQKMVYHKWKRHGSVPKRKGSCSRREGPENHRGFTKIKKCERCRWDTQLERSSLSYNFFVCIRLS